MKSFAVAAIATLCVASSAQAAKPSRKRTGAHKKSTGGARVKSDENYDPYLGMDRRKLAGHDGHDDDHSMSHSMSMDHSDHDHGPAPAPSPTDKGIVTDDGTSDDSGAMAMGTTVSVLAAAGAMMLL
ncbi:hypothetical protein ACHAXR_003446 [Thalassiosira sp. AJA248-18]